MIGDHHFDLQVSVNPRQLASLRRKLEPRQYAQIIVGIAKKAADWGAEDIRSQHWDVGATTRNTVSEGTSFGARIVTRGAGALAVEHGRHAGRTMPNPDVLRDWAQRHGLAGFEFVIARAIARRGHRGRFFMSRTKRRLRTVEIPRLARQALADIGVILSRP